MNYKGYTGANPEGTAVLYARFSSHGQRDVSIDDQLKVTNEYCERRHLKVVNVYIDRALSGTTDKRPAFQKMIGAAPESDYVVVYKFDRFSRGKYDPAIYKMHLEQKGVTVLSATEEIPPGSAGVFLEKMLEAQAAFYSLNLSENVMRGMTSNAEKCMANGYRVFGYDIVDGYYQINEEQAQIVRDIFTRYTSGENINSIAKDLAARGVKTNRGNSCTYNMVNHILHNEKYIGVYSWNNYRKPGGMPAIVDKGLFDMAQKKFITRTRQNQVYEYALSGRLICSQCASPMHGEHGTSHSGTKYPYYACKRGSGCTTKPLRADIVEDTLCNVLTAVMDDPDVARIMAETVCSQFGESSDVPSSIKAVQKQLRENKKKVRNIGDAIESGMPLPDAAERLERLQIEKEALEDELGRLKAESMNMSVDELEEFIRHGFSMSDRSLILDGFLNTVYVFDDFIVATMNFAGGNNSLAEVKFALEEVGKDDPEFESCWVSLEDRKSPGDETPGDVDTQTERFEQFSIGGANPNLYELGIIPLWQGVGLIIRKAA